MKFLYLYKAINLFYMYKYKKIKLKDGSTIDEHRLIMQNHLGRKLTFNEVVHHKDGNKRNNSIENLEVLERSSHSRQHMQGVSTLTEEGRTVLIAKGRQHRVNAKLTPENVVEIRKLLKE